MRIIVSPPMAKGVMDATPNRVFQFFLRMERAFIPNKIVSYSLIIGTSVHEKMFQMGPTGLALKLDECRVLEVGSGNQPPWTFCLFF